MSVRSFSRVDITRRMFNTPLAVLPSVASTVLGVVGPRFDVSQLLMHAGEQQSIESLVAQAAGARAEIEASRTSAERFPAANTGEWRMDVQEGVAHIDVRGELVAENGGGVRPSSGFTGYDAIRAAWTIAQRDTAVKGTIVDIHSGGGEVNDLNELCALMMADRGKKPSRAIIRGMGCSAAYAIAACCDEVTVQDLGYAGSIGVICMHADFSAKLENDGIKVTMIHAGAHKTDGNPFEALPDDVRQSIQTDIDHAYSRFVAHVAAARGMSEDAVRATEARIYRGDEAVKVGLVDKVMGWADSQAEFVARVNGRKSPAKPQRAARTAAQTSQEKTMKQTIGGMTALSIIGSADVAAAIQTQLAEAGFDGTTVSAVAAPTADADAKAAEGERGRILALADLCSETTMSASLRAAIEGGQSAGDFAIGMAKAARERGASVDQLRAGAVQPGELPQTGTTATADPSKPKTGADKAAGILAFAKTAGHAALAHLKG